MKKIAIFFFLMMEYSLFASEKLIPFQSNDKFGFVDELLHVIFSPEFDDFMYCYDGWAYAYKKEEKSTAAYILNCNGRKIKVPNGCSGFVIGKNRYGFTNHRRSEIYSFKTDEKIEFKDYRVFSSPDENFIEIDNVFALPRRNYINLKGELFFSPNEDLKLEWFDKDINRGARRKDGYVMLVDSNLEPVSSKRWGFVNPFSCGLALSSEGFIDFNGNLKIRVTRIPEMDINFQCDAIPVVIIKENSFELYSHEESIGANWAILNSSGKIVKSNIDADSISDFSEDGVAVLYKFAKENPGYYLINTVGNIVNNEPFDTVYPSVNGFAMAKKNGENYLINVKTGILHNCKDF